MDDLGGLLHQGWVLVEGVGQPVSLMTHQTITGVDRELPYGIRIGVRNFLNVDPALSGDDECGRLRFSIDEDTHVGLRIDVFRRCDEHFLHRKARNRHAQNALGMLTDLGRRAGQLHTARFTPSPRMNLSLHDHSPPISLRDRHRLVGRGGDLSRGHWYAVGT